ncbi:MAG: PAS domain S-box protein [Methanomicrobiales archaeon]
MSKKVLIVEDESITALELKRKLIIWGYETPEPVSYGKEAIEIALKLNPDLILMDIVLKGDMDGIEASEIINQTLDIPIIYITAHSDEKTLERAKDTAPYGYILKPIDDKDLKFSMEMALYKHDTEKKLKKLNQSLRVLSDCNQEIIRTDDEYELLSKVCEIIVTRGKYLATWINYVENNNFKKLSTMAKYPNIKVYPEFNHLKISETSHENYPVVSNIKNSQTVICQDISKESFNEEWVIHALENGYKSLISIPLILENAVIGSLNICSSQTNKFDSEEVALLNELAGDIVYGINSIRTKLAKDEMKNNLKKSEEKYRCIVETANEGIWAMDKEYITTFVNKKMADMLGYSVDEMLGKPVDHFFFKKDLKEHEERMHLRREGVSQEYENKFLHNNGNPVWMIVSATALKDSEGNFNGSFAMFTDINEKKKAEEAMHESERQLNAILKSSPIPAFVIDNNHKVIHWNKALEKYTKIKAEEIIGTDKQWSAFYNKKRPVMADLLVDGDLHGLSKWYEGSCSKSKLVDDAYESTDFFPQLNEEGKWLYFTAAPIKDLNGKVIGALETLEDITPQKQAEVALKESEETYRRLLKQSFEAVLIHSQGMIISINDAGANILGSNKEDIIGRPLMDFIHPDYHNLVKERINKVHNKNEIVPLIEEKFLNADGTSVDVEAIGTGFIYNGERAVQTVFRDITKRKDYENQIMKSLNEKDILLKEIHHRVKNNMQIISSLLNLQAGYCDGPNCEIFNESTNRVKSMAIVHEKLYQSQDFSKIDLKEYIQSLTSEIFASYLVDTNVIKLKIDVENIKLNINTAIPLGLIINEMVTNCIKHAFPHKRTGIIEIGLYTSNSEYELIVKDEGIGFPEDIDIKSAKTLGLGLINSLVKQLEGELTLKKKPHTVFKLRFKPLKYDKII